MVKQQALGSTMWAPLTPLLGRPWAGSCWYTNRSWPSSCPQEVWWLHGHHLICNTLRSLRSPGKTHTANCCFVSGSYWKIHVSSPVTMSQTRLDRPSNLFSICAHHSTLPLFCSSVKLSETQRAQRFETQRCSWRILMKSPVHLVSLCYLESSLISDFTLTTFSTITAVTGQPQQLSSSNVCRLTEILCTIWSQLICSCPQNIWSNLKRIPDETCHQESCIKSLHKNHNWKDPWWTHESSHPSQTYCLLEQNWTAGFGWELAS